MFTPKAKRIVVATLALGLMVAGFIGYPRAWTTVLAGAGLKTGQTVGRTDRKGGAVEERPISTPEFMATLCKALDIDHAKKVPGPGNRPIALVDKNARPVEELFA